MLPGGILSTEVVRGQIVGARAMSVSKIVDYEDGGIAINDSSEGLLYQAWKCIISDNKAMLSAENMDETVVYSGTYLTEISFTFDQNMRLSLAYVDSNLPYLQWYDSSVGGQVTTALPTDIVNPRLFLDDKRVLQSAVSDIILGYVRNNNLYYRQQRDRFTIEYLLKENVSRLVKIGMNNQLRLQFMAA